ncbi:hypothetical protein [Sideroxydans sp. CL21]|uniref:hypothetical protein n=1 Tax=Sideroxydans sp. CL21 TaxID=2600596 RepID=UPI0012A80778|nr:hypothetical protein [Sideroxydans sp. CL21]VVC85776.1 hypothetical protein [Sideroxydans sp. CL21]
MVQDDGDIVRGLGFISMYSAWVEEDVDDILRLLSPIHPFDEKIQRWQISRKLEHAAQIVERLESEELVKLPGVLRAGIGLFEDRNAVIHGRIYAGFDKTDYVQSGRPNVPTRAVTSEELYKLANEFTNYRGHLIGPQLFRLPRAIAAVISQRRVQ